MRVGIFGGTFNPVHYGHLINAEIIRNDHSLDRVIFIPSNYPVHKSLAGMASGEHRYNMVQLAIEGNEYMDASRIEVDLDKFSYTIDTMHLLREHYSGSDLYLIIGSDSFNEIDTWKDYLTLIKSFPIIVMKRPSDIELKDELVSRCTDLLLTENPLIDISSTLIREKIKSQKSVRYMLPDSVIDYIQSRGLY